MSKRIIPVALLSSLTLIAGFTFAAEPTYPSNPERNFTTQSVPVARTRAEVLGEFMDFRKNPVSADRWQYVAGERGWALKPHKFAFAGGKFEHTDECDHSTPPKPTLSMTSEEKGQYAILYRNAL
jgi:hypothetical protein